MNYLKLLAGRRFFLKAFAFGAVAIYFLRFGWLLRQAMASRPSLSVKEQINAKTKNANRCSSYIFLSRNGSPAENLKKVIGMIGDIEKIIGPEDIVLIKPNGQWWNQGMTNTDAMHAFIELVLAIPEFKGEIIIAENHHFPVDNSRAWTTKERNGAFNFNELIEHFNAAGYPNVTKCHWHDGGASKHPSWGGAENGGVVDGPWEGEGYVWCPDNVYVAPSGRKAMMSYPVFRSKFSGLLIDFKYGPWKKQKYQEIPLKFINFSAVNHHGQTGVTAAIKNYLGIVDMTCGDRGLRPKGFHNFHNIGFSALPAIIKYPLEKIGWNDTGEYIGGAVGTFMKTIRKADLNIITAEWVGWGDRTDPQRGSRARAIIASRDPVALDYWSAKYILLPATKKHAISKKFVEWNDPDKIGKPFHGLLASCAAQGAGTMDPNSIQVSEYNFLSEEDI